MPTQTATELRSEYAGKRVLMTGHTGFKGGWMTLWLADLDAEVTGYALAPDTTPALFTDAGVDDVCHSVIADIRDMARLRAVLRKVQPHIVFHFAAQPLVLTSYEQPLATLEINVTGTANLLEAIRLEKLRCSCVVVTSDKCYENREWIYGYREIEPVGGHDIYSMSKGAAELVVSSWRRSFFPPARLEEHGVAIASARAGNVVGGGDWAKNRIIPDAVGALARGEAIQVRNPHGVRPWQHVLEPLGGYLLLGARLMGSEAATHSEPWNFGPRVEDTRTVREVVETVIAAWGSGTWHDSHDPAAPHEASLLQLSIEKAKSRLDWYPRWHYEETFSRTVFWYKEFYRGVGPAKMAALCRQQINDYMDSSQ